MLRFLRSIPVRLRRAWRGLVGPMPVVVRASDLSGFVAELDRLAKLEEQRKDMVRLVAMAVRLPQQMVRQMSDDELNEWATIAQTEGLGGVTSRTHTSSDT